MSRFILHVDLGNAAMETRDDVGRALRGLGERLPDNYGDDGIIRDLNGNTVGRWAFVERAEGGEVIDHAAVASAVRNALDVHPKDANRVADLLFGVRA